MKSTKSLFRCLGGACALPALIVGLSLIPARPVTAQTFTILHGFSAESINYFFANSDGAHPFAGLILSNYTLYGTAYDGGGEQGPGTVFAVNTDGTGFTNLHSFVGRDGEEPKAALVLSGSTLYGTAQFGGTNSGNAFGTVFAVKTDGSDFASLYSFTTLVSNTNSDGAEPTAALILSGNTFYGTSEEGGSLGFGTMFAVKTDGTGFITLHDFSGSDGSDPRAGLTLSGDTLYGTTWAGSSAGYGTVFAINTNGTGFTTLHSFTAPSGGGSFFGTNQDGDHPFAALILSGDTLYGTTWVGGGEGNGTVFRLSTDGTGFTTLYSFTSVSGADGFSGTNSDGAHPASGVILSGNILYGTAYYGGTSGNGTLFGVNTNGTGFTTLYSFTGGDDGASPSGDLVLSGATLYGTACDGGSSGNGTVFSLSLPGPPQLAITLSGTNVVLTWPTNSAGFTLQSTTNLSLAVWCTNLPRPVVINGQYTVTNPVSGTQKFYELNQ